MKTQLENKIIELWHISRTALSGMSTVPTRYDRMLYIKKTLSEQHPELITGMFSKHVWFAIEDCTMVY